MVAIKYVQLESDAFLSDIDFQLMTAEQRGVYWTIILYLYRNGGKMRFDKNSLTKLCNVSNDFGFQTVLSKFQVRRGFIYHKRVTKELQRAQLKREQAVMAAQKRWGSNANGDADAMPSEVKGSEVKGSEDINYVEGKIIGLTNEQLLEWQNTFPLVDVYQETKSATQWLRDNPDKSSKKNYKRYFGNWLRKEQGKQQDKAKLAVGPPKCKRCGRLGYVWGVDDAGQKYWMCKEHTPSAQLPTNILNSILNKIPTTRGITKKDAELEFSDKQQRALSSLS